MSDLTNFPNHFLASLSAEDNDLLRPHLHHQELTFGTVLFRAEEQMPRVYFPNSGIISLVVGLSDGSMVEAGMLGKNSVVGGGAALDGRVAVNDGLVQASGSGLTIDTNVLSNFVRESETLRAALMRHELMSYAHAQQIAACNARHATEERMCRWLMQTRDLLESDTLPLTQEFLAHMMGVQRTSVTIIARKLQESGLIRYLRGHIHVLDAEHLQEASCECYETIKRRFKHLIGWNPQFGRQEN